LRTNPPAALPRGQVREHGVPAFLHCVEGKAGIDDRPAAVVFEQPEIDVVQRERKRHPQPVDAGGNFENFAGSRWRGKRVIWQHAMADCKKRRIL